ncbi:hypothetical protein EZMO1_2357 [Endozoicomonas montiporae CL-33]|nr:hypothetical protein EZMO1_2357 [Endozoicomonas montiporae CL-33]
MGKIDVFTPIISGFCLYTQPVISTESVYVSSGVKRVPEKPGRASELQAVWQRFGLMLFRFLLYFVNERLIVIILIYVYS